MKNLKPLTLLLITLPSLNYAHAELDTFNIEDIELNLNAQYLITGNYQPSYDYIVGSEFKYNIAQTKKSDFFVKGGIYGNIESSDSKLSIYSASVGHKYDFYSVFDKDVFVDYSLGLAYHSEEFSTQLIDRTVTTTFTNWEYQADAGIGIDFNEHLSSRLFINQLGSQGTAAGLDVSFRF